MFGIIYPVINNAAVFLYVYYAFGAHYLERHLVKKFGRNKILIFDFSYAIYLSEVTCITLDNFALFYNKKMISRYPLEFLDVVFENYSFELVH